MGICVRILALGIVIISFSLLRRGIARMCLGSRDVTLKGTVEVELEVT